MLRLEGLRTEGSRRDGAVDRALAAHLCRCTGWQTIEESWAAFGTAGAGTEGRDLDAAGRRATLELGAPQHVGADVVLGAAGFSADTAPDGCLVAVPDGAGGWSVADTLDRGPAGRGQGPGSAHHAARPDRRWTCPRATGWWGSARPGWTPPTWRPMRPGASRGATPSPPAANGGAFGGKRSSPVPAAARALADEHGRAVLALWSREDCARSSPKRPPVAGGVRADGTGVLRIARTPGVADAVAAVAPALVVEEVDVAGPPTSAAIRGRGLGRGRGAPGRRRCVVRRRCGSTGGGSR